MTEREVRTIVNERLSELNISKVPEQIIDLKEDLTLLKKDVNELRGDVR